MSEAVDLAVWRDARNNDFILVSLDSDFADLALLHGPPPKVIWLRCGNRPTAEIAELLREQHKALVELRKKTVRPVTKSTDKKLITIGN